MCLSNITTKKAKTAKEDIPCFKVLTVNLYSPYQRYSYKLGRKATSIIEFDEPWDREEGIGRGLHYFVNMKGAKFDMNWFNCHLDLYMRTLIYKAVIPKGAEYYQGKDNYGHTAYVSNELIILEKIV